MTYIQISTAYGQKLERTYAHPWTCRSASHVSLGSLKRACV